MYEGAIAPCLDRQAIMLEADSGGCNFYLPPRKYRMLLTDRHEQKAIWECTSSDYGETGSAAWSDCLGEYALKMDALNYLASCLDRGDRGRNEKIRNRFGGGHYTSSIVDHQPDPKIWIVTTSFRTHRATLKLCAGEYYINECGAYLDIPKDWQLSPVITLSLRRKNENCGGATSTAAMCATQTWLYPLFWWYCEIIPRRIPSRFPGKGSGCPMVPRTAPEKVHVKMVWKRKLTSLKDALLLSALTDEVINIAQMSAKRV